MKPLVSIVINNFNYDRYIEQAIKSALGQTYTPLEVIVVDDGSTDRSRELMARFSDRAILLSKDNGGQASALNVGVSAASGDYILLLDADDYLFPIAIERLIHCFPEGYSRVYYDLEVVDERGHRISPYDKALTFRVFNGDVTAMLTNLGEFFWPPTSANLFSAQMLKSVFPIPEHEYRLCADAYMAVQTMFLGPVRSVDENLGAYRIHGKNNFFASRRLLSDRALLKNRIEDHYRITDLLKGAYEMAGVEHQLHLRESGIDTLQMLCAASRIGIDSDHVRALTRGELFRRVWAYLATGQGPIMMRFRKAFLLSVLLFLPSQGARQFLELKDWWSFRRGRV